MERKKRVRIDDAAEKSRQDESTVTEEPRAPIKESRQDESTVTEEPRLPIKVTEEPRFPIYPPKAHKTELARISVMMPDGSRKAFYLGRFGTPRSHAIFAVMQQTYLVSNGQIVLTKEQAEADADAFIDALLHKEPTESPNPMPRIVGKSLIAVCALVAVWFAGMSYGRPDPADSVETTKPVIDTTHPSLLAFEADLHTILERNRNAPTAERNKATEERVKAIRDRGKSKINP